MAVIRIHNGVNYGQISLCKLQDVSFIIDSHMARSLGLEEIPGDVPDFEDRLYLDVWNTPTGTNVYVLDKKDLRKVAALLSKHLFCSVSVTMAARVLAVWEYGELVKEPVTLDHYYSDLSAEEIEVSRF